MTGRTSRVRARWAVSTIFFVNARGLGLLHGVAQRGALLTGCSPFLIEMLGDMGGEAE